MTMKDKHGRIWVNYPLFDVKNIFINVLSNTYDAQYIYLPLRINRSWQSALSEYGSPRGLVFMPVLPVLACDARRPR